MNTHETAIAKLRQLPDPLAKLVLDFIDFLLNIQALQLTDAIGHELKPASQERRIPGSARGLIRILPDFNAPLDDFREYME